MPGVLFYDTGVYGDLYGSDRPGPHVREKPPLRTTTELVTPSGRHYRWAADEPDPANVPSGARHSDTMPGGFEQYGATLPRKPGVDYADLERLSTVTVRGAGGRVAGEFRLDSAPRTSGDQMAVSPAAVGYQAALEDDKSARMPYVDRDLSHWQGMSNARRLNILNNGTETPVDGTVRPQAVSDLPSVVLEVNAPWVTTALPKAEMYYDAGAGGLVGSVYFDWERSGSATNVAWVWQLFAASTDDPATWVVDAQGDQQSEPTSTASGTWTLPTARRFVAVQFNFGSATANTNDNTGYAIAWRRMAVFGDHSLTKRGTAPDQGFYASDVVAHAVQTWAPQLTTMIQQSSFVIPHLAFLEPTTAGEIVRQASRFDLPDWAVWEDRTFWWTERGAQARRWRARIGPSELEETGPQVERLWESIVVQYQDVDGSTRTVGPPGSGADTESSDLKDYDPENPANKLGLTRRDLLAMGTSTAAGATEVGRRFLLESRLLDRSGKARAVGWVEDDRGVLHPYHAPRAGDEIAFVDASDKSYRRIIRTDKDHDSRTVSFDLDAPPEGLQQLLERLGVVLVPLGVGS